MKPVLLTGGTGFVGRAVARALAERDVPVRHVIRTGSEAKLDPVLSSADEVIATDDLFAQTRQWWKDTCQDIDMVLHAAWYTEPGKYLVSDKNLDCVAGTLALAKGAAAANVRRFVGVGTCFEYDLTPGYLSVDTPLDPKTPYAAAKVATWHMLNQWLPLKDVSFLWGRLFYLFGAGEDPRRLVPYLHAQLGAEEPADLTSGAQIRDFMDVDAAAAMLVQAAFSDRTGAFNVASGRETTVRALAEKIADQYGRRDLLNFGARPDNLTDPPCVVGVLAEDT